MRRAARPRGRSPLAAPALSLGILLLARGASADLWAAPGDAGRSERLVRQGRALADNPTEARAYALRALEFSPRDPDALALLGSIQALEGRRDLAADSLRSALASGVLRVYAAEDVRRALAGVLIGLRRYEEALEVLGPLGPSTGPEALVLGARASARLGRLDASRGILEDATRVHPQWAEAWVDLAMTQRALNQFAQSRAALEAGRSRHPLDPSIHLALITEERASAARKARLAAYFDLPSRPPRTDATAAVLGARYDAERTAFYLDRFLQADGPRYGELVDQLGAELADDALELARLREALAGWTGVRQWDLDEDGFGEYRYVYQTGRLLSWVADLDQDGLEDATVTQGDGGMPASVVFRDLVDQPLEGAAIEAVWGAYPWLVRATMLWPQRGRTYELVPRSFRVRVLGNEAEPPRIPEDFRPPRESEIRAFSSSYRDTVDGVDVARATLSGGALVRLEADTDGDGRIEHVVRYRDGSPEAGERDVDADGVFETREYYLSGTLERLEMDTDGDGRVDYVRRPGDPGLQAWDLDADGELDVQRSAEVRVALRRLYGTLGGGSAP